MPDTVKRGHCLCGAIAFEYSGPELFKGNCHCDSCRRQTASPFTTFMGVANGAWRWTGETPAAFESSPGQMRYFCGICGTPVAYSSTRWPDEIHFYASLLEDPHTFMPDEHYHWEERIKWAAPIDDLPKHEGTIQELSAKRDDPC